ncbi:MAG: papain-like cysteine protease family protein [Pseudomonadota bacterium]
MKLIQRLLNLRLRPPTRLREDAIYGAKTDQVVRQFQEARTLRVDGIVGPNTWRALGSKIDASHRVTLFAQWTNMSCWSAAATMLFGNRSVGPGSATLGPSGGLRPSAQNVQQFANSHGLHMHYPQSWTVAGLVKLLRHSGPLWVAGWVPSGHAVVYAGIFGDGTPDGTMLLIYDPWPPGVGNIRGELYGDWVRAHPTATTYILTRK